MLEKAARAAALLAAIGVGGCESPSARVDGSDLRGVFDKDAGPSASASAAPSASARASASASTSAPPPAAPRVPDGAGCVEVAGAPKREVSRTLGRPACRGSEVLEWRDPSGAPRYACLFTAPGDDRPLPLVVFLPGDGPTVDAPTAVHKQTGLRSLQRQTKLGGADGEPGFHVLSVQGRLFPGESFAGFDAEYAGTDNLDLVTIEHFVEVATERKLVDPGRIYAVGLGPGGQMAATWAMVRADRIAAFASISAVPPAVRWVCPGPPPPGAVFYRACDALVSCEAVEGWLGQRETARAETMALRLRDDSREALLCETGTRCGKKRGTAAHSRWPKGLEKRLLGFLAGHSLAKGARAR